MDHSDARLLRDFTLAVARARAEGYTGTAPPLTLCTSFYTLGLAGIILQLTGTAFDIPGA